MTSISGLAYMECNLMVRYGTSIPCNPRGVRQPRGSVAPVATVCQPLITAMTQVEWLGRGIPGLWMLVSHKPSRWMLVRS